MRVKMWEIGHSFEEIDKLDISDMGDILSFWSETYAIEKKRASQRQNLGKKR
jgi:hypothetical protein